MDWQDHRSISPAGYKRAAKQLGVSVSALGRFLGLSERTSHRVTKGGSELSTAGALLIHSMLHHGDKPVPPPRRPRKGGKKQQF